ncbi:MAG: hypothetical protein ACRERD_02715 [Candidatus Binatia bacterium]
MTNERERHITERHPDLLPEHRERIADTLADPDQGRRSARSAQAQLFVRWFDHVRSGKHVVVIVVTDTASADRHWIITAYLARELTEGEPEWTRN